MTPLDVLTALDARAVDGVVRLELDTAFYEPTRIEDVAREAGWEVRHEARGAITAVELRGRPGASLDLLLNDLLVVSLEGRG